MNYENFYTQNEIENICLYYGQIKENLTYNMIALLIEKFENEICDKVEKIRPELKRAK